MKKPWLVPLVIAVVAAVVGIAIAGGPSSGDEIRITAGTSSIPLNPGTSTTTTGLAAGASPARGASPPTTVVYVPRTTVAATQPTGPAPTPTPPPPSTIAPPITAAPPRTTTTTTTEPPTTPPTTTAAPSPSPTPTPTPTSEQPTTPTPPTTALSTSTTLPFNPDRTRGRVAIASATCGMDEATAVEAQLVTLGYFPPDKGFARLTADATTIYYRPGSELLARVLQNDLQLPPDRLVTTPAAAITAFDTSAEVVLVLGKDWATISKQTPGDPTTTTSPDTTSLAVTTTTEPRDPATCGVPTG